MNRDRLRRLLPVLSGGAPLLPYTADFSTLADGALPARFTGATWTIASGKAINTPVEGTEIAGAVGNGDMETGSPPTGWTPTNATPAADADAHGGLQSLRVTATAAAGFANKNFDTADTSHKWVAASIWIKDVDTGSADLIATGIFDETSRSAYHVVPAAYTQYSSSFLTSGKTIYVNLRQFTNLKSSRFDDLSLRPLTLAQLIASFDAGQANVIVRAALRITSWKAAGVICNLDSAATPLNFVIAFHNGVSIGLFRCVNGVYTKNIGAASTHVAGALIEIRKTSADVYQLWYNGAQVGADQTITNAAINNNTLHGMFNTGGGSQIDSFFVLAA